MEKLLLELVRLGRELNRLVDGVGNALRNAADLDRKREEMNAKLFYLQLLAASGDAATEVQPPRAGTQFGATYTPLYLNNSSNPIKVSVFASFVTAGAGVKLSVTADDSDIGLMDELTLTANGKTNSVSIYLPPNATLFAKNFDFTNFPMVAGDTIRTRVFDPSRLISSAGLYPSLQVR